MSEYRRMTNYLYRNGDHQENRGFVKLELTGDKYRLTLQLTAGAGGRITGRIFLLYNSMINETGALPEHRSSRITRTDIGELWPCPGGYYFKVTDDMSKIPGVPEGVLVEMENGMRFLSDFTGNIDINSILTADQEKSEIQPEQAEITNAVVTKIPEQQPMLDTVAESEPIRIPEQQPMLDTVAEPEIPSAVTRAFKLCTRVNPFEDGELAECVALTPEDIGLLPVQCWKYVNNSFLLHGYYNYGNLVYARRENRNRTEFLLMVPGVNCSKENRMAKQFGFPMFKPVRRAVKDKGEFGYWYTFIV